MKTAELRGFQRRFLRGALAPGIDTAALSIPRGNGKTSLAAHIVARALTPGDPFYERGREVVLISGSLAQSRFCFKMVRSELEPLGLYRWSNSTASVGAKDPKSGVELRVLSSNPKTAFGMVGVALAVLDEPGAFEVTGGEALWDAVVTALGKPGSALRVLLIGTRAPARSGWWLRLLDGGSRDSTYIQELKGRLSLWDSRREIERCNPLVEVSSAFRRKLLQERDAARRDERLKARFLSYRLNLESTDESSMLLTVQDWKRVEARALGPNDDPPIVGIDLGGGRSWSAAVALWRSGRVEAFAVAAGQPDIDAQERRDLVPRGTYSSLCSEGALLVDGERHIPRVSVVADEVMRRWPGAVFAICDRFRLPELLDAFAGRVRIIPRVTQWSEASADIRALRGLALDGELSIHPDSRALLRIALAAASVQNDTSGNSRLIKSGSNQTGRDDAALALTLAAGALARFPAPVPFRLVVGRRAV